MIKKIHLLLIVLLLCAGCAGQPATRNFTQTLRIESHHYYNHNYDDNGSIVAELKYVTTF